MKIETEKNTDEIARWLKRHGFHRVVFASGICHISTFHNEHTIGFKLTENPGFSTYYSEAFGGSILVFEFLVSDGLLDLKGYAPIWLFGFWTKKLSFKENPSFLFKYLKEGFKVRENLVAFCKKP